MAKADRMATLAEKVVELDRFRHNVIAIVEKGGNILAVGFNNMEKTHPVYFQGEYSLGIHAEYDALRQVKFQDLSNASLYVFRFKRDGELGESKPCEHCQKEIEESGIGKVFYYEDGKICKL